MKIFVYLHIVNSVNTSSCPKVAFCSENQNRRYCKPNRMFKYIDYIFGDKKESMSLKKTLKHCFLAYLHLAIHITGYVLSHKIAMEQQIFLNGKSILLFISLPIFLCGLPLSSSSSCNVALIFVEDRYTNM